MAINIQYEDYNDNKGRSAALWHGLDAVSTAWNDLDHAVFIDDFLNAPDLTSATQDGGYYSYSDTGCDVAPVATQGGGGVMALSVDATGDEEALLTYAGNVGAMACISDTAGAIRKCWFEARVKVSAITAQSLFVGLAEEGCPANGLLADDGTGIASKDLVGFLVKEADPDGLLAICANGTGVTTVNAAAAAGNLVADTWVKLGFRFDGTTITYFVDGVELATTTTPAGTYFPDGEELVPLFGIKTHEAVAKTLYVDWVALVVER